MSNNNDNLNQSQYSNYLTERTNKPGYNYLIIPIVMLLALTALLFVPLQCSSEPDKTTFDTDTLSCQQTLKFVIDSNATLKFYVSDTSIANSPVVIESRKGHISSQKSELWIFVLYRISVAIILLLGIVFILKHIVPYWTKTIEMNDKHNDRLLKLAEEQLEDNRKTTQILEKWFKNQIEEDAREKEHQRKIEMSMLENKVALEKERIKKEITDNDTNAKSRIMEKMINIVSNK